MKIKKETALVYCEKEFGSVDGKTAAGLVRYSERYDIVGVIDSLLAGKDAGEELDGEKNGIPIFYDMDEAIVKLLKIPDCYIYGKAPLDACLSKNERILILEAISKGMDIINGLHQFFTEDLEFANSAALNNIQIKDIRKPPEFENLHVFTGQIDEVNIPVVAILGTDCACGKMKTAVELNEALNDQGIKSVLIATGQTSLMQGAKYGISIDALISQFVIGEIEHSILQAIEHENPDIILVEGQSSVSHPAFMSSLGILKGCMPDCVVLQHPPARLFRCDFPDLAMPTIESEIKLIESISQAKVIAITINHENLSTHGLHNITKEYEKMFSIPAMDVLSHGCQKLVQTLVDRFPKLNRNKILKHIEKIPA